MGKSKPFQSRIHKRNRRSNLMKNLNIARWPNKLTEIKKDADSETESFPELEIEFDRDYQNPLKSLCGRRIVNVGHLLLQYQKLIQHSTNCTMGKMDFSHEVRSGLFSKLYFKCNSCDSKEYITTDITVDGEQNINKAAVWGTMSIGIGHSQSEELLALLDIPFMAPKTYSKLTMDIKMLWEDYLSKEIKNNGQREKQMAVENGMVTEDGTPYIQVICDGGWSKRSYGHGYNSASGVAVIIGANTKKPLYVGIRNKVCSTCSYAQRQNITAKEHACALNFNGSSTSMEQDIIVEGFCQSLNQHGLMYKYLIGDGDSSVYARIVERVPYGRQVVKIECANHMTRCFSTKLHKLAVNTGYSLQSRRTLMSKGKQVSRLERLVKGVRTAIKRNIKQPELLRQELINAPDHVFGYHNNCKNGFCTKKQGEEEDLTQVHEPLLQAIKKALQPLINKADCLSYNSTTNQAERFMSLVAKCVGGKRVDFTRRSSYTARVYAATISHMHGPGWHTYALSGGGHVVQRLCSRREKQNASRISTKPKKMNKSSGPDFDYGPEAAMADLPENEMVTKTSAFLRKLAERVSSMKKVETIAIETIGQHDNKYWRELRLDYLTASNFGIVMAKRDSTNCHNIIKNMMYSTKELRTPSILYGRTNEAVAIKKFEEQMGFSVQKCGLFVDKNNPFLAASPDGLVGENSLIEVKCLFSVKDSFIENYKPTSCYRLLDGNIRLKRQHRYYFQVQGQLNITERQKCYFILYSDNDFHVEEIKRDEQLWKNDMLPKLRMFYLNCILPEIIDPRIPRGMKVRNGSTSVAK